MAFYSVVAKAVERTVEKYTLLHSPLFRGRKWFTSYLIVITHSMRNRRERNIRWETGKCQVILTLELRNWKTRYYLRALEGYRGVAWSRFAERERASVSNEQFSSGHVNVKENFTNEGTELKNSFHRRSYIRSFSVTMEDRKRNALISLRVFFRRKPRTINRKL